MTPRPAPRRSTIHDRYRRLLRSGFTQQEAAALLAIESGIDHHGEGDPTCSAGWTWQQVARIQFLRYLVETGRVMG